MLEAAFLDANQHPTSGDKSVWPPKTKKQFCGHSRGRFIAWIQRRETGNIRLHVNCPRLASDDAEGRTSILLGEHSLSFRTTPMWHSCCCNRAWFSILAPVATVPTPAWIHRAVFNTLHVLLSVPVPHLVKRSTFLEPVEFAPFDQHLWLPASECAEQLSSDWLGILRFETHSRPPLGSHMSTATSGCTVGAFLHCVCFACCALFLNRRVF